MFLSNYIFTLVLTVFIELGIGNLMGYREKKYALAIIAVNLFTHPALNYIILVLSYFQINVDLLLVGLLEIGVVLIEWGLLLYMFTKPRIKLLLFSFVANLATFVAGIVIFWV